MASYGSLGLLEGRRSRPGEAGVMRNVVMGALVLAAVVAACTFGRGDRGAVVLSQEIGAYGTRQSAAEQQDTDVQYDRHFGSDPGHVSRAELRFNAALRAAGVSRSGMRPPIPTPKAQHLRAVPTEGAEDWTAYPEGGGGGGKEEEININVYQPKRGQLAARQQDPPRRMTARQAQQDLMGYFNGIDSRVHDQERKRAKQVLDRLGGARGGGQVLRGRRGRVAAGGREGSVMRLLRKAMASGEFQRDLVKDAAKL